MQSGALAATWGDLRQKMVIRGVPSAYLDHMRNAFLAGAGVKHRHHRKPNRQCRPYTRDDLTKLQQMREQGFSWSDISQALGRSVGSLKGTRSYYML